MKKKLPFFFFLFVTTVVFAQEEVLDNNPPSLRWFQLNTQDFRILFPKGFEQQAQRMANTLQHIHDAEASSLGSRPRKISVLLQNQSSISNGFVSMFPRRSEFFTMPPQDYNFAGTNDWLDLLASHEYRHIVQYQHATRGLNKVVLFLFGYPTFAGLSQMAAPPWFWEGDAVVTETAFTSSGRGRIPRFGLTFKSNLLEGRTFNYNKQHLRSFKHFIPDHYVLGYHMVGHLRKRTGDADIWGKITGRSWSFPFVPFGFSNAIKNKSDLYVTDLYRDMASSLKKEWQDEIDKLQLTSFETVNTRKGKAYTDYLYPQPQEDGSVIAMKTGIGDIDQFVLLKDGDEQKLFTPGFVNDAGMLSAHSDVVLWNEYGYHPRWRVKNYSRVKLYDRNAKKVRTIGSKRERFGAAALSPAGDKIVTIHSGNDYKNSIVIVEYFTGKTIQEYSNESNDLYAMPRWSDDGSRVILLKTTGEGKAISILNVGANTLEDILPPSSENVGHPVIVGEYLLFNSPVSGIDNIYAINLGTKKRYQVTVSKYGAYNPAVTKDGKSIYYNEQSRDGMNVARMPFDPATWKAFEIVEQVKPLSQYVAEQEGHQHILDSVPQETYSVRKYSKLKGIINPYSWGFNTSNDFTNLQFGITSKDLLGTTSINGGYVYDINERTGFWRAGVSYQGLFPILDLSVETGNRTKSEYIFAASELSWKETTIEGGVRIPLILTHSRFVEQLSVRNAVGLTQVSSFENIIRDSEGNIIYDGGDRNTIGQLADGNLIYNHASIGYSRVLKTSYRDFFYRWGQTISAEAYTTPFESDYYGTLWAVRSTLYFPGIFKQHYLFFRGAYQESDTGFEEWSYTFRNTIFKPRGYSYPSSETFMTLSGNYSLPLWYPDIAIGPILNIQRIKANLFYDYGLSTGRTYYNNPVDNEIYFSSGDEYQSVGIETTVDFNLFRFLPKFELGFRATYISANRSNNAGPVYEFLIGNIGF
jgi:hypothetical protein